MDWYGRKREIVRAAARPNAARFPRRLRQCDSQRPEFVWIRLINSRFQPI